MTDLIESVAPILKWEKSLYIGGYAYIQNGGLAAATDEKFTPAGIVAMLEWLRARYRVGIGINAVVLYDRDDNGIAFCRTPDLAEGLARAVVAVGGEK